MNLVEELLRNRWHTGISQSIVWIVEGNILFQCVKIKFHLHLRYTDMLDNSAGMILCGVEILM